jgi:hypothetical protein
LVGVGAGVIALSPAIWRRIGSRYGVAKTTGSGLGVIAATTGTALGLALIGGRDLGRLSSVAAPFLCIAVSLYLFALTSRRQIVVTLLGIATTLVAVGAFVTQRLDELGYERFTLGRNIGWIELASVAVVVVVTTVMSLSASAESELGIE